MTASRRLLGGSVMLAAMVKPPPISLRIKAAEATGRARRLLRELEEADLLQRRVKWQAVKALAAIREMNTVALPKLRSFSAAGRDRWRAKCEALEKVLLEISQQGVR